MAAIERFCCSWSSCLILYTYNITYLDLQELLDEEMPDLPEFEAPQEHSDISIELQFPSGIADVRSTTSSEGLLRV